jgi:hypothetical protein
VADQAAVPAVAVGPAAEVSFDHNREARRTSPGCDLRPTNPIR